MRIPVRLLVSETGFNFVPLDAEQHEDMSAAQEDQLLDALNAAADERGPGTHVLTVEVA